jgi:dsRNA-specific ribonuclease
MSAKNMAFEPLLRLLHQSRSELSSPSLQTYTIELPSADIMSKSATQLLNEYMQSGHDVRYEEYECTGHSESNSQYGCRVWVDGMPKGTVNYKSSKKKAKTEAAEQTAKSLLWM